VGCLLLSLFAATLKLQAADLTNAPPPHWESVAAADLALTRGNSESFLATISLNTVRKWTNNEVLLGGGAGYGDNTTTDAAGVKTTSKTQDYLKGYGQFNHLFTERLYAGLRVEGLHDDIADINYRFTISPLAGYFLIKQTNTFLSVELGPSFVFQQLGEDTSSYVGLRLGERFEHKFNGGAKVWETVEFIPQVTDFNNWIMNAEVGISAPITKSFDVRLVAQDSYNNQPAEGRLKNDLKLLAGIGYRF
jgi:putative salt-induced outer membrane protein YdiY